MGPDEVDLLGRVIVPIVTFLLGFLVSRFTLSKKEKADIADRQLGRSSELTASRDNAFRLFTKAATSFANAKHEPGLNEFVEIATSGQQYFTVVTMIADAILENQLPDAAIKNTHLATVKDVVEKSLPSFSSALSGIAKLKGLSYDGEVRRSDYTSIFEVYEMYDLVSREI